jgi:hypothetical protein
MKCPVDVGGRDCGREAGSLKETLRTGQGRVVHWDCGEHKFHLPPQGTGRPQPCDCANSERGAALQVLSWSLRPGCFERHLQRKHGNPLFGVPAPRVTQEEVEAGRARDAVEAEHFRTSVVELLEELAEVTKQPTLMFNEVNRLRERLDDLLERSAQLGASVLDEDAKLARRSLSTRMRQPGFEFSE